MNSKLHTSPLALIGDLGATHTRLALVRGPDLLVQHNFSTQTAPNLETLIDSFLETYQDVASRDEIQVACFGVAGHVSDGEAYLTNVGWKVNEVSLQDQLGVPTLLVNDFYVQAAAIPLLQEKDLIHICGPKRLRPNVGRSLAVLGAGSGLGEAVLVSPQSDMITRRTETLTANETEDWLIVPTEGGHCRFAPRDETEVKLTRWLQKRYGEHISVERVVSGTGLVDLFYFSLAEQPLPLGFFEPVKGAQITEAAFKRNCPFSLEAINRFVEIYADEAANLTLKSNAGVVFLSGGVTPHLLSTIHERFPDHFVKKGRYQGLLAEVSVWAVTAPTPGLFGAQALAEKLILSLLN